MGNDQSHCFPVLGASLELFFFHVLFPLIVISGVCGNVLSIVVWCFGENSRDIYCAAYFRCLAITDLCVIIMPGLLTYISMAFNIHLMDMNIPLCVSYIFTFSFFAQMSSWVTTALTIERTLCMAFPFKFKASRSTKLTNILILVITVVVLALNITTVFTFRFERVDDVTVCIHEDDVGFNVFNYLRMINFTFLTSLVPLIVITSGNVVMITRLTQTRFQDNRHQSQTRSVTIIAVAIGAVFTISTIPWAMFRFISQPWVSADLDLVYALYCGSIAPVYLNNALNPWLYCVFGQGFRTDVKSLVTRMMSRCCQRPRNHGNLYRTPVIATISSSTTSTTVSGEDVSLP